MGISPKDYNIHLKDFNLKLISLEECSMKINRDNFNLSLAIDIKDKVKHEDLNYEVNIFHEYKLIAFHKYKTNFALKTKCIFKVEFLYEKELSPDFLELYINKNLSIQTWPYLREFIQSMFQRVNFPPMTLPFLKDAIVKKPKK